MADINVKLLQGTEAKMAGEQAPAIKNGQLYFATIDEGTKGYIYLDSNGKRFSFGKYAETAGYATEAGAAENAKRAVSADTAGRLQIPILTSNILTTAVSQPAGTSALYFVGSNAITAGGSPANNSFIKIYKNENNNVLIDCYEALNGNHWINSNPNATSATSGWTGWIDLSVKEAAKHWETPVTFQITDGVNDGMGIAVDGSQSPIKLPLPNIIKATLNGNADSATQAGKLTTARKFTIGDTGKDFNGENPLTWNPSEIGYRHEWQATIHGQVWSRLCYIENHTPAGGMSALLGNSFILNVAATRGSVVYNDTFLIKTHHQGAAATRGKIIKISGSEYSIGYSLRLLTNSNGVCYVEIKDSLNSIANGTSQGVVCRLIPFYTGKITTYTAFTSGATLPSGFEVTQEMTTTSADIQAYVEGSFKGNLDGNATSATTASSSAKVNHTLSTNTKYSLSGTTLTASGSSDIVFDTGIYTDTTPGHLVVTGGIDNTGDLKQADGHIYLTGAQATSSTGNTTQVVFGTPSDQHVVLSSNRKLLVINPTTSTYENQILFYLDQASSIPSGLQVGSAITPIVTGQTSLGTTSLKFSSLHLSGDANIGGGASVDGNLTVTNKTTLNGVLDVVGASTFTGLITANGGVKGNVTGNLTGNADTATEADKAKKWSATKAFKVVDASGENAGTAVNVDGTADVTLKMPTKFKGNHTIDGNLTISGDTSTSGNVILNGSGKTFTSNIDNKFVKQIKGNISAAHGFAQGGASGYHLISIVPTSSWMLAFTIRVYQAYTYTDIAISGYNYPTDQTWYSPKATIIGTNGTQSMDVVFGCSAANKLWLAIPAGNYYGIDILNVTNGYTQITDYSNLFTLSVVATLPTSTPIAAKTITAYAPWYRGEIVSTENGGTGNNAFTANRLLYSETATKLSSSGHYSTASQLGVNCTNENNELTNLNFYVQGNSKFSGELNVTGNASFDNLITQGTSLHNSTDVDSSIRSMNRFNTDVFISGNGSAPNAPTVPGFYLGKSQSDDNRHMDIVSGENVSYIDFNKATHARDFDFRIHANVTNGLVDFQWGDHSELTDKRLKINGLTEINSTHTTKNALKVTGGAQISNTLRIGVNGNSNFDGNWCEGIRINADDGEWVTIALGTTGETQTNTHCWSIHRTSANKFAIAKNSSSGLNGLVLTSVAGEDKASDGKMGLGTDTPTHRLHVVGDTKTEGTLYLERNKGVHAGKINFWRDTYHNWVEYMAPAGDGQCPTGGKTIGYGDVTTYARRSIIENISGYGWMWESSPVTTSKAASTTAPSVLMSLSSNTGKLKVKGAIETENNLIVNGNTTLGDTAASDTVTVNAKSTFNNTLTVATGGAQITGNSKITGTFEATGATTLGGALDVAGKATFTGGAKISGRYANGGDDEGLIIGRASNEYAGVCCGDPSGVRSVFYLLPSANGDQSAVWRFNNGSGSYNITHPCKSGTIMLTSDTAGKAVADADGNTISSTYLKKSGGTMTGQLLTSFKSSVAIGSYSPTQSTMTNLLAELRYSSGCMGSLYLTEAYGSIPVGWYNYIYAPHRSGGINGTASGDNCDYGNLLLMGMNNTYGTWRIRFSSGAIASSARIIESDTAYATLGYVKKSGDTMTGNLTVNSASARTTYTDEAASMWCGVSTDGNSWGLYHITDSKYIIRLNDGVVKSGYKIYGAVWNDYAEYRKTEVIEPGRIVVEHESGEMKLSSERLQAGANVTSDTFGFAIGETDECKTPIAVAGRALVYTYEDRNSYPLGAAVCAAPGGTVSLMTREEIREWPDRIIGTVSEIPKYETWGEDNVSVNGRIWIKVR